VDALQELNMDRLDERVDANEAVRPPGLLLVDTAPPVRDAPKPAPPRSRRLLALAAVGVLALGSLSYWLYAQKFEDTDDAQVDGNISNLSPRVAGNIKVVHVVDNQEVAAGQLLAEIDPADLEVAVAQAKAAVAQAEAQLRAEDPTVSMTQTSNLATLASDASDLASAQAAVAEARKSVEQLKAQLAQAEASDKTAQLERRRAESLIGEQAIAQSEADQRVNAGIASTANVEALAHALEAAQERVAAQVARVAMTRSRLAEVQANAPRQVEARRAAVVSRQAALELATAQLAQAELNLGYAKITAPTSGIVGKKSINVGDHVAPGQQIMAISQIDTVWVTANFRETQLRHVRPGQAVELYVDAIASKLRGTVESIGGATGSRYSVLPPENASGNYVKVVQRIPVRIKLDKPQPGLERLRVGMSVEPKVSVR
jgi:membrane fusion protein (multidrug efflux system)